MHIFALIVIAIYVLPANAQAVYATVTTPDGDINTRFDYVVSVSDVFLHNAIIAIALSAWAIFFIAALLRRR